jgi:hypothetical protein
VETPGPLPGPSVVLGDRSDAAPRPPTISVSEYTGPESRTAARSNVKTAPEAAVVTRNSVRDTDRGLPTALGPRTQRRWVRECPSRVITKLELDDDLRGSFFSVYELVSPSLKMSDARRSAL